ncbi:MAG TPA: hypothetical protein VMZ28_03065 [Kofleriaceae bacterium]|nr:hypothetical protein [Kofleriaceae bacterium]
MPITTVRLLLAGAVLAALPVRARASGGEVIVIEGQRPRPHVRPRVKNHDRVATPPYSDAAIESDAWTRAWLLLDVDEAGRVARFKFIRRPGHDLEPIAALQAFRLRFDPARDAGGRPIKSWVIWGIEWPSYWWLVTFVGTATRMPPEKLGPHGVRRLDASVPCRGGGPLDLDSLHPVYRDCSLPDLSQPFDAEPWIRPAARRSRP